MPDRKAGLHVSVRVLTRLDDRATMGWLKMIATLAEVVGMTEQRWVVQMLLKLAGGKKGMTDHPGLHICNNLTGQLFRAIKAHRKVVVPERCVIERAPAGKVEVVRCVHLHTHEIPGSTKI